jgi:hypothetical protein
VLADVSDFLFSELFLSGFREAARKAALVFPRRFGIKCEITGRIASDRLHLELHGDFLALALGRLCRGQGRLCAKCQQIAERNMVAQVRQVKRITRMANPCESAELVFKLAVLEPMGE